MKRTPVFNVFRSNFNGKSIEIVNFFSLGQWLPIRRSLMKLKRQYHKAETIGNDAIKKLVNNEIYHYDNKRMDIGSVINTKLQHECSYYFRCKCEHEVMVTDLFDEKVAKKVDIYKQLEMNWESFRSIVFADIGL